jgi:peroxiredoxin
MRSRPLRRSSARTLIAALAVASALALAGCSTSSGSNSSSDTNFVKGTGETSTVAVKDRGTPISISGKDLDGGQLSLSDYRGKIVVLNVWGSWCSPCRAEADGLESVYTADKDRGVQFVGIDTRDLQTAQPKAFVADHNITYPSLYDPAGDLLLKFPAGTLNPQTIPTTIILDRQGRVAARALLPLSSSQLTQMLAPVLAEKS